MDKASKERLEKIEENIKNSYKVVGVDFEIVKEDVLDITDLGIRNTIGIWRSKTDEYVWKRSSKNQQLLPE